MSSGSLLRDVKKTWDALVHHGATPVGSEALEVWRIVSGNPYTESISAIAICHRKRSRHVP